MTEDVVHGDATIDDTPATVTVWLKLCRLVSSLAWRYCRGSRDIRARREPGDVCFRDVLSGLSEAAVVVTLVAC